MHSNMTLENTSIEKCLIKALFIVVVFVRHFSCLQDHIYSRLVRIYDFLQENHETQICNPFRSAVTFF